MLIQSDVDWIVRVVEADPTVDWFVRGFSEKNHCAPVMPTERPVSRARLPNALLIGVDQPGNNALVRSRCCCCGGEKKGRVGKEEKKKGSDRFSPSLLANPQHGAGCGRGCVLDYAR